MISMSTDTLALEQIREAETRRNLTLMHHVITILRLTHDKLANLVISISTCTCLISP